MKAAACEGNHSKINVMANLVLLLPQSVISRERLDQDIAEIASQRYIHFWWTHQKLRKIWNLMGSGPLRLISWISQAQSSRSRWSSERSAHCLLGLAFFSRSRWVKFNSHDLDKDKKLFCVCTDEFFILIQSCRRRVQKDQMNCATFLVFVWFILLNKFIKRSRYSLGRKDLTQTHQNSSEVTALVRAACSVFSYFGRLACTDCWGFQDPLYPFHSFGTSPGLAVLDIPLHLLCFAMKY